MAHAPTTRTIASLGIVIVTLVAPTADAPNATIGNPAAKPVPVVEVVEVVEPVIFAFPVDETVYEATIATFEEAGFEAPVFLARFHDNDAPCQGYRGLHVKTSDGVSTVNVCAMHETPMINEITREHTLMHEVAHVWVDQNVTEQQMSTFMELRGLSVWDGNGAEWGQLGAEHAAEILLWGLTDETRNINVQIDDSNPDELQAAYEILTER